MTSATIPAMKQVPAAKFKAQCLSLRHRVDEQARPAILARL